MDVKSANVFGPPGTFGRTTVGDEKLFFIRGKSQAIGMVEIISYANDLARMRVNSVHVATRLLTLGACALIVGNDAVVRVGEPDRAIRLHHRIVG